MKPKEFTITETAGQLNVTRQYVYKKLDELKDEIEPFIILKNNVKYLKPEGIGILRDNIKNTGTKLNVNTIADIEKDSKIKNALDTNNSLTDQIINNYEGQIKYLKDELSKKDEVYNGFISDLKERITHFEKESLEKNKLLENMQVLLKDQKLLTEQTEKKKFWNFWKK